MGESIDEDAIIDQQKGNVYFKVKVRPGGELIMCTMALSLPMNYVEVDRDEMEYVDGAGWVYGTMTAATQQKILTWGAAAIAGTIAAAITYGSAGLLAALAPTIAGAVAGLLVDVVSNNTIRSSKSFCVWVSASPWVYLNIGTI